MNRTEQTTVRLAAPRRLVFPHLTDYDRFGEWVPGVTRSRVLEREGDIVVAEFASPLGPGGKVVLELVHTPPEAVIFTQVERYRRRGLSGRLEFREEGEGRETALTIVASVGASPLDLSSRGRLRSALAAAAAAAVARTADLAAAGPTPGGERKKILEVVRRGGTLDVWFRGERFTFPEAGGER